jgi:hypothetical protein
MEFLETVFGFEEINHDTHGYCVNFIRWDAEKFYLQLYFLHLLF